MTAKRSVIPVFIPHLGCPQTCVFCDQGEISGTAGADTAKAVLRELKGALEKIPQNCDTELAFYGGSFTAIPAEKQTELLSAVLPFLHSGEIRSIRISTRPDAIDEETLERLRCYGVKTIELGAQSMCDEVLKASKRGHLAKHTVLASKMIKRHGFRLILQMMTGLPCDSRERAIYTAQRIIALAPNGVRIYPAVVLKDTALYDMWKEGTYEAHTVEQAVEWCVCLLEMFTKAGIPVIRLGLNPSSGLSASSAAAGAFHPAFGELVRSQVLLESAREVLRRKPHGKSVKLGVNKSEVSALIGQKRAGLTALIEEFSLLELKIEAADVEIGKILLL